MPTARIPATPAQAKAIANPLRLRILRMCLLDEMTNQQLAQRLDRDPSTILHHVRLLVDTGFLEPAAERPGPRGSTQKPYRTTGLSWHLDFGVHDGEERQSLSMFEAFRAELLEAGPTSIRGSSRFVLHLDEEDAKAFQERLLEIVEDYLATDEERRRAGKPPVNALVALHELAPGSNRRS